MGLPWLSGLTRVPSLLHISTLKCKITKFYKFKIERILEAVLSNSLQYFCSRKGEDKSYSQWKTTEKHSLSTVFGLVPRRKRKCKTISAEIMFSSPHHHQLSQKYLNTTAIVRALTEQPLCFICIKHSSPLITHQFSNLGITSPFYLWRIWEIKWITKPRVVEFQCYILDS
jgi:hypothetical protein